MGLTDKKTKIVRELRESGYEDAARLVEAGGEGGPTGDPEATMTPRQRLAAAFDQLDDPAEVRRRRRRMPEGDEAA